MPAIAVRLTKARSKSFFILKQDVDKLNLVASKVLDLEITDCKDTTFLLHFLFDFTAEPLEMSVFHPKPSTNTEQE